MWILKERKSCIWKDQARSYTFSQSSSFHYWCKENCLSYQKQRLSLQDHEELEEWILYVNRDMLKRCSGSIYDSQTISKEWRSNSLMWQITYNL